MSNHLEKELPELIQAGVISEETASRIRSFYQVNKKEDNRILTAFGVIGAVLVGLGIILIIAHNWDDFSKSTKTIFSFLPLFIGQVICTYSLFRKQDNTTWLESSSVFLFFAVGASISLISQVYNLSGELSTFLLTWILLCIPLAYIMRSSITSLLCIVAITYWGLDDAYWSNTDNNGNYTYGFWLLLLLMVPYYYLLYKQKTYSNAMALHNWFFALSIVIMLNGFNNNNGKLMIIAYMSLFGCFYLIGTNSFLSTRKAWSNSYLMTGLLSTIGMLLYFTFDDFWNNLYTHYYRFEKVISMPDFYVAAIISAMALMLMFKRIRAKTIAEVNPFEIIFAVFILVFIVGTVSTITAQILSNAMVLLTAVFIIRDGANKDHLGILNFGLVIIALLVICRFFDSNISFIIRGSMFLIVGLAFFLMNSRMIKKRKRNEV